MQGWQLVLTGHSLGAGVAALLVLKMLRTFPDAMHRPPSDCMQGWQLVLTGHSLGAGVAALLALKMLRTFPKCKVWAFCPPGGLMTGALGRFMEPFCTSVVLGKVRRAYAWLPPRTRQSLCGAQWCKQGSALLTALDHQPALVCMEHLQQYRFLVELQSRQLCRPCQPQVGFEAQELHGQASHTESARGTCQHAS